jgi:hypothetical protein
MKPWKALPYAPIFLAAVAAALLDGIVETEWPSTCGYGSMPVYPTVPAANPPELNTPKVVSPEVDMPSPVPTNTPAPDAYSPIPPPQFSTKDTVISDPSVNFPHAKVSGAPYGQGQQAPQPDTDIEGPNGVVQSGSFTFYTLGLGACGQNSTGQDESGNIVSLSKTLFDAARIDGNPNHNPLCGRTITIDGLNGKTSYGTILDRCENCKGSDIHVSQKLFKEISGTLEKGRIEVQWWYN